MTLQGFHTPLTPKGLSTLNPAPPWSYSSDFINIEYWADPEAVAAILPEGVEPDPDAAGHANALFYDWQFTGAHDEFLDPARYQYREMFFLVDAICQGKKVSYCPYIFVDNDAALARGWSQGYPKRIGSIAQTRYFAAHSTAAPQLEKGSRFAASLSSCGQRLAFGSITLTEPTTDATVVGPRPVLCLQHVPDLQRGRHDQPLVHRLALQDPSDVQYAEAWSGQGALTVPECDGEEISDLGPVRVGRAVRASMSYVVDDLVILGDSRE